MEIDQIPDIDWTYVAFTLPRLVCVCAYATGSGLDLWASSDISAIEESSQAYSPRFMQSFPKCSTVRSSLGSYIFYISSSNPLPLINAGQRYLSTRAREPTDYTPVWSMRQPGRYLPEYNKTCARAGSFLALAQNPDDATEVTLQPLARFPLDAAILFSDILTIPDAMGLGLAFEAGRGPRLAHPVREEADIARLQAPSIDLALRYVTDAIRQIRYALRNANGIQRVPLIGFSGSPWTLACYMVEGGPCDDFRRIKSMLYARPDLIQRILDINTRAVVDYLNAQIGAGVNALMIFDTWGGALAHRAFQHFSLASIARVIAQLRQSRAAEQIPVIVFTKGGGLWLEALAASGADALGLDWTVDLASARQRAGKRVALQGNLDPAVLLAPPDIIRAEVRAALDAYGPYPGHIFNLGHGILPCTPPRHVAAMVEEVHAYSRALHQKASKKPDLCTFSRTGLTNQVQPSEAPG